MLVLGSSNTRLGLLGSCKPQTAPFSAIQQLKRPCVLKRCNVTTFYPSGVAGLPVRKSVVTFCAYDGQSAVSGDGAQQQQQAGFMGLSLDGAADSVVGQASESRGSPVQSITGMNVPANSSWESWLKFFEEVDAAAEEQEDLTYRLQDAVRQERYGDAAAIKRMLSVAQEKDSVAHVQQQMQAALALEQYAEAAKLRDDAMAGLQGWWAGASEDDPVGHLLHVQAEFGRWTGRAYRPRDIAEMKVKSGKGGVTGGLAQRLERTLHSRDASSNSSSSRTVGSPIMEVFVRPAAGEEEDKASRQRFTHQAVSLRVPTADEVTASREARKKALSAGDSGSSSAGTSPVRTLTSPVVRLNVSIGQDGTASIRPVAAPLPRSKFSEWEAAEAEAALRELREAGRAAQRAAEERQREAGSSTSTSAGAFSSSDEDAEDAIDRELDRLQRARAASSQSGRSSRSVLSVEPDEVVQLPSIPDEVIDISSQRAMSSIDGEEDHHGMGSGSDGSRPIVDYLSRGKMPPKKLLRSLGMREEDLAGLPDEGSDLEDGEEGRDMEEEGEEEGLFAELKRVPAAVEMLDRDSFVFRVPDEAGGSRGRPAGAGPASAASSSLASSFSSSSSVSPSSSSKHGMLPTVGSSSSVRSSRLGVVASTAIASAEANASEGVLSFEVEIPVGQVSGRQAATASSSGKPTSVLSDGLPIDTFEQLAEQVARLQEAKVGRSARREELAEALREITTKLATGEVGLSEEVQLPPVAVSGVESGSALSGGSTSITYKRIPLDYSRTDPLSGLFVGSFGPHGPELLRLSRVMVDGEEMVTAVKLTGDANVPAGTMSFRSKVSRKHKLDSRDVYPEELGIVARYKGEGRVAQKGFTQPRWVEGELLVFNAKGNPVTGGAELGFVWAVPGEKRFLILLNRVDLRECEQ
mmetsp:Transcript_37767/g.84208  ORF Transcript_37767/g.84208 Transcript_37767/m.84208 type:complete len:920 (+) Transcript_37767:152-2911(+)